jgi:3-oxoadipate enol-lactonase
VRAMLTATPPEGYMACCAAVRDMDQRDAIAGIRHPTLVIAGTHDAVTPPAEGRATAERIRGARYVELDAAHLSNVEAADRFTAEAVAFIAGESA